eukprot:2836096-Pleurochrysis_carterae.AAC.1
MNRINATARNADFFKADELYTRHYTVDDSRKQLAGALKVEFEALTADSAPYVAPSAPASSELALF